MDFFTQQERARRRTKWLVGYFLAATAAITGMVYLVVSVAMGTIQAERAERDLYSPRSHGHADFPQVRFRGDVLGWVALGTLVVIGVGSLWRLSELSSGGSSVATMLGCQAISPNTSDPDERKLLNVVEEMAIASGVPVPPVYLIPDESINAFAAGYRPSDAVVGVTRGCMRLLNRDELQGVIAHEFSHILNGDMRLNLRLVAWVFGIMGLAVVGRILLHTRGRKNPLPLVGLALILIGWVGVLFGRLIQSAVSRQREFLADASALQFTRNPHGLAGALKKIGGLGAGSRISSPQAAEVSHMFFANGLRRSFLTPFATHPPLEARIRAIEPDWDGVFPKVRPPATEPAAPPPIGARRRVVFPPIMAPLPTAMLAGSGATALPRVGEPTPITLHYAAGWRESLPAEIGAAAREPFGAEAILFAMLLSGDAAVRGAQLRRLTDLAGEPMTNEVLQLQPAVAAVSARARLPLVDLCLPTLRGLSGPQFKLFEEVLQAFIEADQQIDLFEYTLQRVVRRHLASSFTGARRKPAQYYALQPLLPDCAAVFKLLSHIGAVNPTAAETAWRAGWTSLGSAPPTLPAPSGEDLIAFDAALERLDLAAPAIKRNVVAAAAHCVGADGQIREREAELIRAIADTLDCPIPPFVRLGEQAS